jgi:outer membrane protein assembly factor BamB
MANHSSRTTPIGRAAARIADVVGGRLLIWGGVAILLTLVFGNFWVWFTPRGEVTQEQADRTLPPAVELEPGDWPHLRGPNCDGVSQETDLADSWPAEGPPVLWIREIGEGYSGLIRVGARVFTQTQTRYHQSVLCLDADSGETIWEHHYSWPYEQGGMYPGPRATPTWHVGRIYFAGPRGEVGCLAADDGRLLWRINVVEKFGASGISFGYSCTPLVVDGLVILPVGGEGASVVALDADTGAAVWASGSDPASYCGALPITLHDRPLIVALMQNTLLVLDRQTGNILWRRDSSQGYDEHAAWPIYDDSRLTIANPFRKGAVQFGLEWSPSAGKERLKVRRTWDSMEMSNDVASCVLCDGVLFGFDLRDVQTKARRASRGTFRALDFESGKVLWSDDRPGHAAPIVADGKLLMLNDRGEVILARATSKAYEELGRADLFGDEICWTAPTLSHDRLYLRSPTRAACLYVGRPEGLSEAQRAAAVRTSEITQPTRWDLSRLVGGERPFPFDLPDMRELGRSYLFSIFGVFAVAMLLAAWTYLETACDWPRASRLGSRTLFWSLLIILGAAGTALFNRFSNGFVFTWPVVLFAVHQLTLAAVVWAPRQANHRRAKAVVIVAVLCFFATCLIYFDLCRRVDLAVQWVFLIGLIPSWPAAVPAAYSMCHDRPPWRDFVWALLSFTLFFWSTAAVIAWRLAVN